MKIYEILENILGWVACLVMAVILLLGGIVGFIRTRKWKNPFVYQGSSWESLAEQGIDSGLLKPGRRG